MHAAETASGVITHRTELLRIRTSCLPPASHRPEPLPLKSRFHFNSLDSNHAEVPTFKGCRFRSRIKQFEDRIVAIKRLVRFSGITSKEDPDVRIDSRPSFSAATTAFS